MLDYIHISRKYALSFLYIFITRGIFRESLLAVAASNER